MASGHRQSPARAAMLMVQSQCFRHPQQTVRQNFLTGRSRQQQSLRREGAAHCCPCFQQGWTKDTEEGNAHADAEDGVWSPLFTASICDPASEGGP